MKEKKTPSLVERSDENRSSSTPLSVHLFVSALLLSVISCLCFAFRFCLKNLLSIPIVLAFVGNKPEIRKMKTEIPVKGRGRVNRKKYASYKQILIYNNKQSYFQRKLYENRIHKRTKLK
jgi:hypothetical protein